MLFSFLNKGVNEFIAEVIALICPSTVSLSPFFRRAFPPKAMTIVLFFIIVTHVLLYKKSFVRSRFSSEVQNSIFACCNKVWLRRWHILGDMDNCNNEDISDNNSLMYADSKDRQDKSIPVYEHLCM